MVSIVFNTLKIQIMIYIYLLNQSKNQSKKMFINQSRYMLFVVIKYCLKIFLRTFYNFLFADFFQNNVIDISIYLRDGNYLEKPIDNKLVHFSFFF